jgi:uncharacterized membrane protein
MKIQGESLWDMLLAVGVVQGDEPQSDPVESPWYVKVLLALSGWVASIFLFGTVGILFESFHDNSFILITVGAALILAAYSLLRIPKNEFYEHAALAISLAGQGIIIWRIFDGLNEDTSLIVITIFASVLAVVMPNYIHRVISSFAAGICFSMAVSNLGIPYITVPILMFGAAWLWLNEFKYPEHMRKQSAVGYGLILALVFATGQHASADLSSNIVELLRNQEVAKLWIYLLIDELLVAAIMLYVVWNILQRLGHGAAERISIAALIGIVLLSVVSYVAHGISVAMFILIIGFSGSNRVLMGIGVISLLSSISAYYYFLNVTLLEKALVLLLTGMLLIVVRWVLLHTVKKQSGVQHG